MTLAVGAALKLANCQCGPVESTSTAGTVLHASALLHPAVPLTFSCLPVPALLCLQARCVWAT